MSQEINEMLGGRMSNQDEDEVEDELAAMEREVVGVPSLPNTPSGLQLEEAQEEEMPAVPQEVPASKVKNRNPEPIAA